MRIPLRAALIAGCFVPLFAGGAFAQGFSGNYVGTYTASKLPGQTLHIGLYFHQTQPSLMLAAYATSSGVAGQCTGPVQGNKAYLTCINTTPSCKGTYRGTYVFSGDNVTWTYSGTDCLGNETGKGMASKVSP
jgi:hypothetical protein